MAPQLVGRERAIEIPPQTGVHQQIHSLRLAQVIGTINKTTDIDRRNAGINLVIRPIIVAFDSIRLVVDYILNGS